MDIKKRLELRRSSAASPIPGKRVYDLPWQDDEEEE